VNSMRITGAQWVHAFCSALIVSATSTVCAQNAVAPESSLKAAYLYHFIQFTEWPSSRIANLDSFGVCVIGENQTRPALTKMNGKIAHGKRIELRVYDLNQPARCQVVVFNAGDREILQQQRANLMALNVLTVAENPAMGLDDAIITLLLVDGRFAFSIDKSLARSSGLDISSKLLRLARSVK
jgi:hypothetical protein